MTRYAKTKREQNVKNQSYGGVLIAVSTNLLSEEVTDLQSGQRSI